MRTGCREQGVELDFSIFILTISIADAVVTAPEEDAGATYAEHCEQSAQGLRIFQRAIFLVRTVRRSDRLWDLRLGEHVLEPLKEHVARGWLAIGIYYRLATVTVIDVRRRVRHGRGVLDIEVRLKAWVTRVILAVVDLLDGVCRVYCVPAKFGHERRQIRRARVLIQVARNPELVPVRRGGLICERLVQPAQVRRLDLNMLLAARQRLHELSRRHLRLSCCCSDGAPAWCLLQRVQGGEKCCRHDGLHVLVQHHGECIAYRADNGFFCPGVPVELI